MFLLLYLKFKDQPSQTSKRQHLRDVAHVGLVHVDGTTQVALVLCGLLGEDVALERLTALDGATRANAKTLFRAALGLHLGHLIAPFLTPLQAITFGDAWLACNGFSSHAAVTRPPHGNL
jgi:hypothetical protein